MAKAYIEEIKQKKIHLELTEDETIVLRYVLGNIGGSPEFSPRKHINFILNQLDNIGYTPSIDNWDRYAMIRGKNECITLQNDTMQLLKSLYNLEK